MNANFGNGVFNSTLIETDLDGNLVNNGEMPFWLRDIIERAFSASGIHVQRKVASEDAIASLHDVELSLTRSETCPICFEEYMPGRHKQMNSGTSLEKISSAGPEKILDQIAQALAATGVDIPRIKEARMFVDPSLLLPVDCAATYHARFPISNLQTRVLVTQKEMFPVLTPDSSSIDVSRCGHTPVSMPHCGHIFGKPCIIEWLSNHISCPLCRKEVEALRDDALTKKVTTIRQNCNFVFDSDIDELVSHLARHSTDVFNPFRKTMKPSVTPLTDSSIPQAWATSADVSEDFEENFIELVDPPLVMTRRFPLTDFGSEPSVIPFGSISNLFSINRPFQPSTITNPSLNVTTQVDEEA